MTRRRADQSQAPGDKPEKTDHYKVATHLVRLLERLDAGEGLTDQEIAQACGVKDPCARRYRAWLTKQRGLKPLKTERGVVWRPERETTSDPATVLRAAALSLAVEALADLEGTAHFEALRDLSEEARGSLTADADARLLRLTRSFQVRRAEAPRHAGRPHFLRELIRAIDERLVCDIEHQIGSGEVRDYRIEPWGFVLHKGRLLLVAGKVLESVKTRERRFYNVDGLRRLSIVAGSAAPPPARATEYERLFRDSFGIWILPNAEKTKVHLIARGSMAAMLEQRSMHPSQHESRRADGTLDVHFEVVICPEFRSWVRSMIPDVQVVSPVALRDELRAEVSTWLAIRDPETER